MKKQIVTKTKQGHDVMFVGFGTTGCPFRVKRPYGLEQVPTGQLPRHLNSKALSKIETFLCKQPASKGRNAAIKALA